MSLAPIVEIALSKIHQGYSGDIYILATGVIDMVGALQRSCTCDKWEPYDGDYRICPACAVLNKYEIFGGKR